MAKSSIGMINHLVGVQYVVTGLGNLKTKVFDMGTGEVTLAIVPMNEPDARLPFRLANFKRQKMQIEFRTTDIDETFIISEVVAYMKPSATGYPQ